MKNDEILAKSRKEGKDEGVIYAHNKGRGLGVIGFSVICIFIVIFNFFNGISSHSVFSLFSGFVAMEAYGKYTVIKQKTFLVTAIAGGLAALGFLANYVLLTLRG